MKRGWKAREEAARLRRESIQVDPEIRAQRDAALKQAKAALYAVTADEAYNQPVIETDEAPPAPASNKPETETEAPKESPEQQVDEAHRVRPLRNRSR